MLLQSNLEQKRQQSQRLSASDERSALDLSPPS
jgi:hypothetical protein